MAVILLSGGLDSALNLALGSKENKISLAITVQYGQRAQKQECKAAESLAKYYNVDWVCVNLEWLGKINQTGLTKINESLPQPSFQDLDSQEAIKTMQTVWVANRNGLFLNLAASFAEARNESGVIVGFNSEEASTFPDNSQDFIHAVNQSLSYSTLNKVCVSSYTTQMNKTQIIQKSIQMELPLDLVWSCYEAGPKRCWKCESCKRSERALLAAGAAGESWLKKMEYYL